LKALEFVEGPVEGTLDAGFVAAEGGEGVRVSLEDVGEFFVFGGLGIFLIEALVEVVGAEVEEAGFDVAATDEPPLGHYNLLDQCGFEGAGGLKVVFELL
jgi:hypothetical protein